MTVSFITNFCRANKDKSIIEVSSCESSIIVNINIFIDKEWWGLLARILHRFTFLYLTRSGVNVATWSSKIRANLLRWIPNNAIVLNVILQLFFRRLFKRSFSQRILRILRLHQINPTTTVINIVGMKILFNIVK